MKPAMVLPFTLIALITMALAGCTGQNGELSPAVDVISTGSAPAAVGPYSQAVRANGLIFVSGQLALDPASGLLAGTDTASQTRRCLENFKAVLAASGCGLNAVVKTTVFLKDMNDFTAMNTVYAEYFPRNPPARSTVEVARLPRDGGVEIEAVAIQTR
jgi:2-iminobutanoate/2-iminopropanoate deaminase